MEIQHSSLTDEQLGLDPLPLGQLFPVDLDDALNLDLSIPPQESYQLEQQQDQQHQQQLHLLQQSNYRQPQSEWFHSSLYDTISHTNSLQTGVSQPAWKSEVSASNGRCQISDAASSYQNNNNNNFGPTDVSPSIYSTDPFLSSGIDAAPSSSFINMAPANFDRRSSFLGYRNRPMMAMATSQSSSLGFEALANASTNSSMSLAYAAFGRPAGNGTTSTSTSSATVTASSGAMMRSGYPDYPPPMMGRSRLSPISTMDHMTSIDADLKRGSDDPLAISSSSSEDVYYSNNSYPRHPYQQQQLLQQQQYHQQRRQLDQLKDQEEQQQQRFGASNTQKWISKYKELIQFVQEHGHSLVPLDYKANPSLAHWVKRQRCQYKARTAGSHSTLTPERLRLLEDLDFCWDSHRAAWEERSRQLLDFRRRYGHCNVPSKFPENQSLAIWVKCQRRQFKLHRAHKKSNLNDERILALTKMGFVWTPREVRSSPHPSDV